MSQQGTPADYIKRRDLSGRRALVTGGSRGIGRATCLALAARNVTVGVHYNGNAALAAEVVTIIEQHGGRATAIGADLLEDGAGEALVARASSTLGPIDILVNNAATMADSSLAETTDDMWQRTLTVNLSAVFHCTRACLPGMQERRWGRIINVSSQAAFTGSANHAHYATTKAGLLGFTYSIAKEVGEFGITANVIVPGRILTDMLLERAEGRRASWLAQTPLGRLGQPDEVATAIAFLASEEASYITGATLHVNGGLVMG